MIAHFKKVGEFIYKGKRVQFGHHVIYKMVMIVHGQKKPRLVNPMDFNVEVQAKSQHLPTISDETKLKEEQERILVEVITDYIESKDIQRV